MHDLTLDLLRLAHLFFFSAGIGTAILLEALILRGVSRPLTAQQFDVVNLGHHIVRHSLFGLWATGLAIFGMRTGFALDAVTPKLLAKFAVVSLLTANMIAVDRVVMPMLRAWRGRALSDLPAASLSGLGAIVGLSAGAWAAALMLGAVGLFKTLSATVLIVFFGTWLLAATLLGGLAALSLTRLVPRPA